MRASGWNTFRIKSNPAFLIERGGGEEGSFRPDFSEDVGDADGRPFFFQAPNQFEEGGQGRLADLFLLIGAIGGEL